ncbi:MAG: SPOR domain-containing protein [Flavobacteriaceae bacterium]
MNKLFLIVITVSFTCLSYGQQGVVSIEQDAKISKLLEVYKSVNSKREFYTIQIGFGSYREAEKLKQDVEIDFPQWRAKIVFDSPTYRVRVGSFKTKLEAERNFIEIREKYPQSLILRNGKTKRN